MKGVIYCYHCISTGKKYIGQSINEKKRKIQHISLCGKGIDHKFYRAVRKYGWDNFIYGIIDYYHYENLNEQEIYYVETYDTYKNGYNSTLGGEGMRGFTHNEKTRQKISESNKNRTISEKTRQKISEAGIGRTHSEETRKKISDGISGKNHPMYGKVGELHHGYGISRSDETKEKISNTLRGRTIPKEITKRRNQTRYGNMYYEITKPDGIVEYVDDLKSYAIENGLYSGQMYNVANGKANHHKGYKVKKYIKTLQP
jgi:group I intron endonuclease